MEKLRTLILMGALTMVSLMTACVVYDPHHAHSAYCGHYYSDGRWQYVPRHVHGPDCGHVLNGGIWVTIR